MIKKIWQKWFPPAGKQSIEVTLHRSEHQVSRKNISPNALKVLTRLDKAGYEAFLVGGGVRDLLLGLQPKDFDVATSATPEQIKRLFRNCRIIGRRFKLAHIIFGPEVIEVATFRAEHKEGEPHGKTHASGMLMRDNVYGSSKEDAIRRDFTVNALYYSAKDFSVRDFTGGLNDLAKRQLRLIGDPLTRYQEDPVRMLRAVRLSCKLDLAIEPHTAKPITKQASLLTHVSSARLWDESHKLFLSGFALKTFEGLNQFQVFEPLYPATYRSLQADKDGQFTDFIKAALDNTDRRIAEEKPVTPAFLYAVFLWQPLQEKIASMQAKGMSWNDALHKSMGAVINEQNERVSIPKRFAMTIKDIWTLQSRLEIRNHKSLKYLEHPKFRAAYDFLLMRSLADPKLVDLVNWWTRVQEASPDGQQKMVQDLSSSKKSYKGRNKRPYKRRKTSPKNQKPQASG